MAIRNKLKSNTLIKHTKLRIQDLPVHSIYMLMLFLFLFFKDCMTLFGNWPVELMQPLLQCEKNNILCMFSLYMNDDTCNNSGSSSAMQSAGCVLLTRIVELFFHKSYITLVILFPW